MKAIDLIHRPGVTIQVQATVTEAAALMEQAGVGCLAVVDGDTLRGVVTDRDLVCRVLARRLSTEIRIDSVMSAPALTVAGDAELRSVTDLFRTHAVRRAPVVHDGECVGMITVDDLIVVLTRDLADIVQPVTAELIFAQHDSPLPVAIGDTSPKPT